MKKLEQAHQFSHVLAGVPAGEVKRGSLSHNERRSVLRCLGSIKSTVGRFKEHHARCMPSKSRSVGRFQCSHTFWSSVDDKAISRV